MGVVEFETEAAKIGLYRKIRGVSKQVDGRGLWFAHSRTYEERARDKTLGRVKYHLIEDAKIPKQDIRINWKKGAVSIKFKKVAWLTEDMELCTSGEAVVVKQTVDDSMNEWREGRRA